MGSNVGSRYFLRSLTASLDDMDWPNCKLEVVMEEVDTEKMLPFVLGLAEAATSPPPSQDDATQPTTDRFVCQTCSRSYKHLFHLKAHLRECSKEPLFSCDTCNRRFYHMRNLARHRLNVHKEGIRAKDTKDTKDTKHKNCKENNKCKEGKRKHDRGGLEPRMVSVSEAATSPYSPGPPIDPF